MDSGGQPQFNEVLPAFIYNIALILLVLKLSEPLDAYSELEFCDESGITYKERCTSLLSNEEILEHQVRTLQARSCEISDDRKAMVAVIGTHRDEEEKLIEEGQCKETTEEKNKKLWSIMHPGLFSMLILYRKNEIIFPMNMLNPDDNEIGRA